MTYARRLMVAAAAATALLSLMSGSPTQASSTAGPTQITAASSGDVTVDDEVFLDHTFELTVDVSGLKIAGDVTGTEPWGVDDQIDITFTRPDGTTSTYTRNFEFQPPADPVDLTSYVQPGNNVAHVVLHDTFGGAYGSTPLWFTGASGGGALSPDAWALGDVHVHSTGDAGLRSNLLCRREGKIPTTGTISDDQERDCARYLLNLVATNAKDAGLSWVVLAEHGVWLGVSAAGNDPRELSQYDESEARKQWNMIREEAAGISRDSGVRMLMGEEIGSAPPVTLSGHYSAYYAPDYVANSPFDKSEGQFLQRVNAVGGWGAVNHPGTGSTWGCWVEKDKRRVLPGPVPDLPECPDGVVTDFPDQVAAVEVVTSRELPKRAVLDRWSELLIEGLQVAAVGGGDTHTASRVGVDVKQAPKVVMKWVRGNGDTGRQKTGNIDALGEDGRAVTLVDAGSVTPGSGYETNDPNDAVRSAIRAGRALASNGPRLGLAMDGAGPGTQEISWKNGAHKLELVWDENRGKPTAVRLVIGQRVSPAIRADCGRAGRAPTVSDCTRTQTLRSEQIGDTGASIDVDPATFFRFRTSLDTARDQIYVPATFVRVEVEYGRDRAVYSSPFYLAGLTMVMPRF